MNIKIVRAVEAESLLADPKFKAEWSRLRDECSWATLFQGPEFATVWYQVYRSRYEPVLILSHDIKGTLNGLMPLAVSCDNGGLVVAGGWQAEYQAWLCWPALGQTFAWHALRSLRPLFPNAVLRFQYVPPGTPTDWVRTTDAGRLCTLTSHRRPLMRLAADEDVKKYFKNKTTRNQLNRLKTLGTLQFSRITDCGEFETLLDDIIVHYDFRHAAVHGLAPFRDDPLKKPFHLALMKVPGLLHATALKFGDEFGAAHIGVCENKEVHLGIIAHNACCAQYSPGKFHILFLAQLLRGEGVEQLDLTPGGDAYKDRFANRFDEVSSLTVHFSRTQRIVENVRVGLAATAKRSLRSIRVEPTRIKSFGQRLRRINAIRTPATAFRMIREWVIRNREMRIYSYDAVKVPGCIDSEIIRCNALDDLLCFKPVDAWQSGQQFLSTSLHRIENGMRVYTAADNGCLLHYGWLIERQKNSYMSEVGQEFSFPPNSACLFDFFTCPHSRGRGLYTLSLRTMLQDAARISGTDKIFIAVLADNVPSRHVIEKVGFTYECSLFEQIHLGMARRWCRLQKPNETASGSHTA